MTEREFLAGLVRLALTEEALKGWARQVSGRDRPPSGPWGTIVTGSEEYLEYHVNASRVAKGLARLHQGPVRYISESSRRKITIAAANLDLESLDAWDAAMILQVAIFEEVVY